MEIMLYTVLVLAPESGDLLLAEKINCVVAAEAPNCAQCGVILDINTGSQTIHFQLKT